MVAHELGTPLTAVMGYSELLAGEGVKQFPEELVDEMLVTVHKEAERLSRIVDDLLDISRMEAGQKLSMNIDTFCLSEVVEQTLEQYGKVENSRHFELILPGGPVEMSGDSGRIKQLLGNLFSNAVKYSPQGGVVRVAVACEGGACEISVADQGLGLTETQLARVFDKFYRADSSNTAIRGTGLGLSIARHIVDAHGGNIWMESRFGHGTTVHFVLPVCSEEASVPLPAV